MDRPAGSSRRLRGTEGIMYHVHRPLGILAVLLAAAAPALAADRIDIALTLPRAQYTVAEPVELALLYHNEGGNARTLPLVVRHGDGSTLTFDVPFDAKAAQGQSRLVRLNGGT